MEKMLKTLALLTLTFALVISTAAFAEPSDTLQTTYDALVAEGSSFDQSKTMYAEWYEGVTLDAALEDNSIVITQDSTNEWVESGNWTFIQEDDAQVGEIIEDRYVDYSYAIVHIGQDESL